MSIFLSMAVRKGFVFPDTSRKENAWTAYSILQRRKKFIEIEYSGGRKNGRAVNWHRNGQVQWERTFKSDN